MNEMLVGLDGVVCHMDNVLIIGRKQQEHDTRLQAVLQNSEGRCYSKPREVLFRKDKLTFLGHVIDKTGLKPDPWKTAGCSRDGETKNDN